MNYRPLFLALPLVALIGCETTLEEPMKRNYISSYKGLSAESESTLNRAQVKKSDPATLRRYTKVMIDDVKVISSRSVPEGEKRASRAESEKLAEEFEVILKKELSPHYQITNRRGRDTMLVRAALTDLEPSNPGVFMFNYLPYAAAVTTGMSLVTGKTPGAGSSSVEAEVIDSVTRRQLYAIVDKFKGSKLQPGGLEKWGQSQAAMRIWSRKIRMGIQAEAPQKAATTATAQAKHEAKTHDVKKAEPKKHDLKKAEPKKAELKKKATDSADKKESPRMTLFKKSA